MERSPCLGTRPDLRRTSWFVLVSVALAALGIPPALAIADVSPGDVIDKRNIDLARDLLHPGLQWCVEHGLVMQIVPYEGATYPSGYVAATEKYAAQVGMSPDGLMLNHYVAGQPFPRLDPTDQRIAYKIMWNYYYNPYVTDDFTVRYFDADTGMITDRGMVIEKHFLMESLRRLMYNGRIHVDPRPAYDDNPEGFRYRESLHPVLEPFDLKGIGSSMARYLDAGRQDDTWLYMPQLRRVRRISSAQRSDALFGQDIDMDSYGGYSGNPAWFEWRFVGASTILAAVHGKNWPAHWCEGAGDFVFCDMWEKRKVWIVEGRAKFPQYAYGKRVLYVDQEAFYTPSTDIYDRNLELWKIWINGIRVGHKPFEGAKISVYEYETGFIPNITMVDMQLSHATRAAIPSHEFPDEEGWYWNMGPKVGLTPDFFTVAELIRGGR
ncbi:MAG: DUF1329 domain-containing protein [Deltaproteobacteria bacterium]|nr:DUF1329 domain-containing protein [Deltaproteobacteria bacterium]